jgi:predicted PurR-regulated permease PerM
VFGAIGIPEFIVVLAIAAISLITIWPASRICRRVGFPWWLGLLIVVPLANMILLWFVAFADWPLEHIARQTSTPGRNA